MNTLSLAALQVLLLQTLSLDPRKPMYALVDTSKALYADVVDGAQETWQDISEVVDEVSQDAQEIKQNLVKQYDDLVKQCSDFIASIDLQKIMVQKIGQHEISFFELTRSIDNAAQLSDDARAVLRGIAGQRNLDESILREFTAHIDCAEQVSLVHEILATVHASPEWSELRVHAGTATAERVAFKFELFFCLKAADVLDRYPEHHANVYPALFYAKMLLKAELGLYGSIHPSK